MLSCNVRPMKHTAGVVVAIMCSAGVAVAEGEQAAASGKNEFATVSWSPAHLMLPMVELEAEVNVVPHVGIGVIAGFGRVSDEMKTVTATAYELGGQASYYFMRPFSGLHGGVEAMYMTVGDIAQDSTLSGEGLSLGGYVGYKLLTSIGFTFVAQGGVAYLAVKAESSTATAMEKRVYPLINLNIGWSF